MPHKNKYEQKNSNNETPLSTRLWMVLCGFAILGLLYYFFGDNAFPRDITYRNVPATGNTYIYKRENP